MSNMIITAEDAYKAFLRGIRKYSTTTVKPVFFNPFFNDAIIEWVKGKLPLEEFNQKRIDDLEKLRVVTDGSIYGETAIAAYPTGSYIFPVPSVYSVTTLGYPKSDVSYGIKSSRYPLYMHGLNAMFKKTTDSEWKNASIMRSDKRAVSVGNPYREPSNTNRYYEVINDRIRLIGSTAVENIMRLEYIRYPRLYNYSITLSECVNPEFLPSQNKEIVDIAIRKYLEIIQDPRYKSFLQEEVIRSNSN